MHSQRQQLNAKFNPSRIQVMVKFSGQNENAEAQNAVDFCSSPFLNGLDWMGAQIVRNISYTVAKVCAFLALLEGRAFSNACSFRL